MAKHKKKDLYRLFDAHAETVTQAAQSLGAALKGKTPEHDLESIERESHRIKTAVTAYAEEIFVTPFDREDIFNLSTSLDEAVDSACDAASFAQLAGVQSMEGASQLADMLEESAGQIAVALNRLRKSKKIHEQTSEIERIEHEAAALDRRLVAESLRSGEITPELLCRRELQLRAMRAIRAASTAGDILLHLVIKHA